MRYAIDASDKQLCAELASWSGPAHQRGVDMSFWRTVGAVVLGFVVIQIVVMVANGVGGVIFHSMPDPDTQKIPAEADTPGLCLWNILWYLPCCAVGAWLSTRIAKPRPWRPVLILLALVVVLGVVYAVTMPAFYREMGADIPGWCLPLLPVTGAIGLLLGGWIGAKHLSNTATQPDPTERA